MATFSVTNTNDIGIGSLRQAILDANALSGKDLINFDGVFADQVTDLITLSSNLNITDDLSIDATGRDLLTFRATPGGSNRSVFEISSDVTVEIEGLNITNSGGQFINNSGIITLKNSNFLNNTFSIIINNTGTLTLSSTTIRSNSSNFGPITGISNINGTVTLDNSTITGIGSIGTARTINSSGGTVTINNSTISNQSSRYPASAITSSGILTISNSTISNNNYAGTVVITNSGVLTVRDSVFSNNFSTAISNTGTLTVSNTSFDNNGGGISNSGTGTLTVSNSTINNSGNSGITNASIATVNNTTISGNQESGIRNSGTLTVDNSTIIRNSNRGTSAEGSVGGIYNSGSGTATVNNSIIAGNFVYSPDDIRISRIPDVLGNFISNGYNLIGDLTGSTGFTANEQIKVAITEVLDLTLRDNGGTVKTHALVTGSPAINAGNNVDVPADVTDLDSNGDTTEQVPFDGRGSGFARISGGTVDIGAFEAAV